jgi:DNA-binding CsgD family transcriptional regulator
LQAAHDPTDLLPAIVDGVLETPPWGSFLNGLRRKVSASYTSLIFRRPDQPLNAVVHLFSGEPSPPVVHQLYHDQLYRQDPMPYERLTEARPYATGELLRLDEPSHSAFYREIVVPSGMAEMRIMRVQEASGVNAWLTIARGEPEFGLRDDALLTTIAPVLRSALATLMTLERERFSAAVTSEAMRRLRFGWFTLDPAGRVLDADPQGARTLSGSSILRRTASDRLAVRPPELEREVLQAIREVAADTRRRPRAITLSRDPWLDMLLVPINGQAISAGPSPAVVAYVHGDRWRSIDRCEQLAQLFGLSPSEARLALALSRGMSIAEAAAELGLTVGTARVYSKKIYAKTGARGQPDLIRFVMRSVLAIA